MEVPIRKGLINLNPVLTQQDIVDRLSKKIQEHNHNSLHFMVGGIGLGKTTFLCNLLYKNWTQFIDHGVLPLRVNVDRLTGHQILNDKMVVQTENENGDKIIDYPVIPKLVRIITDATINSLEQNSVLTTEQISKLKSSIAVDGSNKEMIEIDVLKHLFHLLRSWHNLTPTLIVDNLDYLFHLGDRGIFNDKPVKSTRKAFRSIIKIVEIFSRNTSSPLKDLGINVLYVVRPETINFLQSKLHELGDSKFIDKSFSLDESHYDIKFAREVIQNRFLMLKNLSSAFDEPKNRKDFLANCEQLELVYLHPTRLTERILKDLWGISRRGLRDFIDLFGEYSWIDHEGAARGAINTRFITQYSPSIIAYILGGHNRYTQFSANIPNVFLVNTTAKAVEPWVPKSFKKERLYTVWIKYFLLQYLIKKKSERITNSQITKLFCGSNGRGYHRKIVQFSLGSLAEVPNVEFVNYTLEAENGGVTVKDFSISDRAQYFMKNMSYRLTYLQLIVDEHRMLIPTALSHLFEYKNPSYNYLVLDEEEYRRQLTELLKGKGRQTIYFSMFLDAVLKAEIDVYPHVYSRLREEGIDIPKKDFLLNSVTKDLKVVLSANHIKYESVVSQESIGAIKIEIEDAVKDVFKPHKELLDNFYPNSVV